MDFARDADISVIIPTYNAARYIGAALDSVLAQTVTPREVLVIDDGSSDDTAEVVRPYTERGVLYHHQPNGGVSRARNTGLELTSGEFVAFLDSDDIWPTDALATHLAMHRESPNLVFSFGDFERFDNETGRTIGTQFVFYPELSLPISSAAVSGGRVIEGDAFCTLVSFSDFPAFTQAMMFRRSLIGDLRFDETLRICEDAHFVLRACVRGNVAFATSLVAKVRRHDSNATSDYSRVPLDKLQALLRFPKSELDHERQQALDERICRARFDAARMYARRGNWMDVVRMWKEAVAGRGSWQRKAKSSVSLLLTNLRRA